MCWNKEINKWLYERKEGEKTGPQSGKNNMNSVRPFEPYISITTKRYALRTHTLNDKHLPIPRFTVVKSVKHELHKSFNGNCRWFFRNQKGTLTTQHTVKSGYCWRVGLGQG